MKLWDDMTKPRFGRKALVGQFTRKEGERTVDLSEVINAKRSKTYKPNGARECARRLRQMARR